MNELMSIHSHPSSISTRLFHLLHLLHLFLFLSLTLSPSNQAMQLHVNAEAGPSTEPHAAPAWPTAPEYDFSQPPSVVSLVNAGGLESEIHANFFRHAVW
jgi:hypothetical protein